MHALNRLALAAAAVALAPQIAHAEGPPLGRVKVYCQPGSINNCSIAAPEPSSIALVASGLVGTGLFGRRRRKA